MECVNRLGGAESKQLQFNLSSFNNPKNRKVQSISDIGHGSISVHPLEATPKAILKLMDSEGLTIFHVKSHLQVFDTDVRHH